MGSDSRLSFWFIFTSSCRQLTPPGLENITRNHHSAPTSKGKEQLECVFFSKLPLTLCPSGLSSIYRLTIEACQRWQGYPSSHLSAISGAKGALVSQTSLMLASSSARQRQQRSKPAHTLAGKHVYQKQQGLQFMIARCGSITSFCKHTPTPSACSTSSAAAAVVSQPTAGPRLPREQALLNGLSWLV